MKFHNAERKTTMSKLRNKAQHIQHWSDAGLRLVPVVSVSVKQEFVAGAL